MIRNFREDDLEEVMNIWLHTNIMAHDFIEGSYWESKFNEVKEMMPSAMIFVFEEKGIINGFIGLADDYIAGIFVRSEYQSKGIGKKLLDHAKGICNRLYLQVYKKNARAVNFYLREGFSIQKEQIDGNTGEIEYILKWK